MVSHTVFPLYFRPKPTRRSFGGLHIKKPRTGPEPCQVQGQCGV